MAGNSIQRKKELMNQILDIVKKYPDLIDSLSDERLEQLISIQEIKIKELDIEIAIAAKRLGIKNNDVDGDVD